MMNSYIIILLFGSFLMNNVGGEISNDTSKDIEHVKVYYEEGKFAGWPANNGIWSWEDEILVGFVQADHMERSGHTYDVTTSLYKYARSLDGGETWSIEDAYNAGKTALSHNHQGIDSTREPQELKESIDFSHPDLVFTLSRMNNNDGPSHFYYSYNKGKEFKGPFIFPNLGTPGVAARTDYIADSEQEASVFLTIAKENQREGRVAMFRTNDGGLTWTNHAWIGDEPQGFDIMPSSVRLSETELITTIRSRDTDPGRDYVKAFYSNNNGKNWSKLNEPAFDAGAGGSPPALVKLQDGRLALSYIFRSKFGSRVHLRFSADNGQSWSHEITVRSNDDATGDVGYPQMVQRSDGKLVIVYYWNHAGDEANRPYRYIAATIVDPDQWS